jgi:hypothetical protein
MLAATTRDRLAAILFGMLGSMDVDGRSRSLAGEDGGPVRVESVGQAAAGGLLLSIAIVELALGFWAAGWNHRAVALSVALVGLVFLALGVAEIAAAVRASPAQARSRLD